MARKHGFGRKLFLATVAGAVGGVIAYRRRREIEQIVRDIADQLDAREEDGFFSVDLGDGPVIHKAPLDEDASDDPEDGDFVDDNGEAADIEIEIEIPAKEETEE